MPIKKELYHPQWEQISDSVRFDRAGGRCESCGVTHGAIGARDANGQWRSQAEIEALAPAALGELYPDLKSRKMITIYLTTAHLSRDEGSTGEFDLMAYCQKCHLDYDRYDNWQRRRRNIVRRQTAAGQRSLLNGGI